MIPTRRSVKRRRCQTKPTFSPSNTSGAVRRGGRKGGARRDCESGEARAAAGRNRSVEVMAVGRDVAVCVTVGRVESKFMGDKVVVAVD